MKFGVSNHAGHASHWFQTAYGYDPEGPLAGVRYDAYTLTKEDGKGKWWEGLDPQDLYTGRVLGLEIAAHFYNSSINRSGTLDVMPNGKGSSRIRFARVELLGVREEKFTRDASGLLVNLRRRNQTTSRSH